MTKKAQNLEMVAGDHADIVIAVTASNGVIKNLTGATIKWTLYDDANGAFVLNKTTGGGVTVTDGPGGVCTVALVPADTLAVAPGIYYHECEVTVSGIVSTVLIGHVTILATKV